MHVEYIILDGDPKKINFDNDTAYSSGSINWGDPDYDGDDDTSPCWFTLEGYYGMKVEHDGGSSGSPAFNT